MIQLSTGRKQLKPVPWVAIKVRISPVDMMDCLQATHSCFPSRQRRARVRYPRNDSNELNEEKTNFDTICATNRWMLANGATVSWKIDCCREFFLRSYLSHSLCRSMSCTLRQFVEICFGTEEFIEEHRNVIKTDSIAQKVCTWQNAWTAFGWTFLEKMWTFENLRRMLSWTTDSIHESHVLAELPESTVTTHQSGGFSPPWTVSTAEMDGWLIRK